jgi:hypothetical protein
MRGKKRLIRELVKGVDCVSDFGNIYSYGNDCQFYIRRNGCTLAEPINPNEIIETIEFDAVKLPVPIWSNLKEQMDNISENKKHTNLVMLEGNRGGMKYDQDKIRMELIPPLLLEEVGKVLTYGAEKYAPNSWQTVPNAKERYLGATYRHLTAYHKGEQVDSESGELHLAHAIANLTFLIHLNKEEQNDTNL